MPRIANTREEYRTLFAKTGNQCAFPGCFHPLVDDDNDFVAEVCHIEAAGALGERYNPEMTDENSRSVENLIVLCHRHHVKTNNTEVYTVARLKDIKARHERYWGERPYELPEQALHLIFEEQHQFEQEISRINAAWREHFYLAMNLKFCDDPSTHIEEISSAVHWIERLLDDLEEFLENLPNEIETFFSRLGYDLSALRQIPYYESPFHSAFWEKMNIGRPNLLNVIGYHLKALEVHAEIEKLKAHPSDTEIREKLDRLKMHLSELAETLAHVD